MEHFYIFLYQSTSTQILFISTCWKREFDWHFSSWTSVIYLKLHLAILCKLYYYTINLHLVLFYLLIISIPMFINLLVLKFFLLISFSLLTFSFILFISLSLSLALGFLSKLHKTGVDFFYTVLEVTIGNI